MIYTKFITTLQAPNCNLILKLSIVAQHWDCGVSFYIKYIIGQQIDISSLHETTPMNKKNRITSTLGRGIKLFSNKSH